MPAPNIIENIARILPSKSTHCTAKTLIERIVAAPQVVVRIGGPGQPAQHDIHEHDPEQRGPAHDIQRPKSIIRGDGLEKG
jgi:hypothetical protein